MDTPIAKFSTRIYKDRLSFLLEHYKDGRILDIGNIGNLRDNKILDNLHLKFKSAIKRSNILYGIDLIEPAERKKYLFENQVKADIEQGIPFKSKYFDTVHMGQVLEHLKNPFFVLCEVKRVLKDDGIFVLSVPNPYSISAILRYMFFRKDSLGNPAHIFFATPASLVRMIRLAGFSVKELATDWKERMHLLPKIFKIGLGSHLLMAATKLKKSRIKKTNRL